MAGADHRRGDVTPVLRQATIDDIAAMHGVRLSVLENQPVFSIISEDDYRKHLEELGRGWVVEIQGEVVGFAIANATDGNVWALFVHPDHERRGYGRRLHDAMVSWLWKQGLSKLWLTTDPGTRAQGFYESAGWCLAGSASNGQLLYELRDPPMKPMSEP